MLSRSATGLHPITGPAELILNVLPYISTLIAVPPNIKDRTTYAEAADADSK
jgi:hypothetical protein